MREVARATGVSIATVSKALGNKPDISQETRSRVLSACAQLGYKTNPLVAALMRSRRRHRSPASGLTLAFVTAFPTADGWRKHPAPIFRQMFAGAQRRASERNYCLEHHWLYQEGMTNRRFSQVMEARGIKGLLFAPVPDTHTAVELNWNAFSTVVLGLTPSTRRFHRVTTDYYQSMMVAMDHCRQIGYMRPGFAGRVETATRLEHRWEAAFRIGQDRLGFRAVEPLLVEEWTQDAVEHWLRRQKPDVVIGPVLGKLEQAIGAAGRKIPDDVGLVGLLVPEPGDRLTGIVQDGETLGETAVDQLISQIERNETGLPEHPITHTMTGRWNPGRTVRSPDFSATQLG
jgi:DNA-binding LacI/PurR family transcriptional regulator